jgi:uncharacterized protein YcfJ
MASIGARPTTKAYMHHSLRIALGFAALAVSAQAMSQITFYEAEGFRGRVFATEGAIPNLKDFGFNDRASSVIVEQGRWEVCDDVRFNGRCMVLRPGSYDSLSGMGMNDRISSVRQLAQYAQYANEAPAPLPAPTYEYRRRPNEQMFEAPVTSVRAVMGPPEQRCWVEHQQALDPGRGEPNVGAGLAGAIIGGILGHQIGGGSGKDLATVGGVVAGAVIGANAGRDRSTTPPVGDVRHCEASTKGQPVYWDVTYDFQGVQHHVQLARQPGATISVNNRGEPRQ